VEENDFLFVYGTLRCGEGADLSKNLNVKYVGTDYINGLMYRLGWYPGLKAPKKTFNANMPIVLGDVFLLRTPSITTILDRYEGYPTLYGREQVETALGRTAWVYTYNGEVDSETLIENGDWINRDEAPADDLTKLALSLGN
jgi:gamma-glutamylcyclotransferase (GGCT)/AIG2-like uncharacterized protein YtfP